MGASTVFPFARAAAAFAAYERNARDAVRWAHPSWLEAALGAEPAELGGLRTALATAPRAHLDACSLALIEFAGVRTPPFDALRSPNPAVLDALPAAQGQRVLRMRSLFLRRAEVRRLIDKRSRRQISEWVGLPIDQLMAVWANGAALADRSRTAPASHVLDPGRLGGPSRFPALDRVDAELLAQEGCALMLRDARSGVAPFVLLRLALPVGLGEPAWFADGGREVDPGGTARVLASLPELLPEWPWLSG
ncbi:type III secretion protein HrpB4 [Paraburkholderia sediminicola]|uniref:type III secretion protein HrpB4 n=1 Tax=Paraburkholderia sediminicola TaxID=458836 RepID=UPI0038BA00E2